MLPLALLTASLAASSDDLVEEVVVGHRATLDLIRTFSATVSYANSGDPSMARSSRYLRDGERSCIQFGTPGRQLIALVREPGRTRQLSKSWVGPRGQKLTGPLFGAAVWLPKQEIPGRDVWRQMALAFYTRDGRYGHLGEAVAVPGAEAAAKRDLIDGRPVIWLRYTYYLTPEFAMRATQWHDPTKGYLVVRRDLDAVDGSRPGSRNEVTDFVAAGGVEFPTKATSTVEQPDGTSVHTTTVTDLQINRPLPAGAFDLTLPAGTRVLDDVRKSEYVAAGPDWKPAGPEKPWSRVAVVPPAAPADAPTRQSAAEEPHGWTWWLVAASGAVLVVGGAAAIVRRATRSRDDTTA